MFAKSGNLACHVTLSKNTISVRFGIVDCSVSLASVDGELLHVKGRVRDGTGSDDRGSCAVTPDLQAASPKRFAWRKCVSCGASVGCSSERVSARPEYAESERRRRHDRGRVRCRGHHGRTWQGTWHCSQGLAWPTSGIRPRLSHVEVPMLVGNLFGSFLDDSNRAGPAFGGVTAACLAAARDDRGSQRRR